MFSFFLCILFAVVSAEVVVVIAVVIVLVAAGRTSVVDGRRIKINLFAVISAKFNPGVIIIFSFAFMTIGN